MALHSTLVTPCMQRAADGWRWRLLGWAGRLAAIVLLAALGPMLIATGIVIVLLSRRSPLVAHRRIGQHGRPFWTLKFRTMWTAGGRLRPALVERIVDEVVPRIKTTQDARVISRFARFCRRFSIDELPQLVNVMRGEMALVGPRPLTREELRVYYAGDAPEVLSVKPGMTGLWQVMGRSRLSYVDRRRLDLMLVRRRSPRLYCWILLRTVPEVLNGRNAW